MKGLQRTSKYKISPLRRMCLLLLFASTTVHAQNSLTKYYNHTSGLSDHVVNTVYQHSNGMTFIGTSNGLDVFDGSNIININRHPQIVRDILPYRKDSILVIRSNAILILNTQNYSYTQIDFSDSINNALNGGLITGDTLYCSSNSGLVQISLKNFSYRFLTPSAKDKKGEQYRVFRKSIAYDPLTHSIYQGYSNGVFQYSIATGTLHDESSNPNQNALLMESMSPGEILYKAGSLWLLKNATELLEYRIHENQIIKHNSPVGFPPIRQIYQNRNQLGLKLAGDSFGVFNLISHQFQKVVNEPGQHFSAFKIIHLNDGSLLFAGAKGLAVTQNHEDPLPLLFDLSSSFGGRTEFQNVIPMHGSYYIHFNRGLAEYNPDRKTCIPYYSGHDLRKVYQIIHLNSDTLLMTGVGGYVCFDVKNKTFFKPEWFNVETEQIFKEKSIISAHYDSKTGRLLMNVNASGIFFKNLQNGNSWHWNGNLHGAFRSVRAICYAGNNIYVLGAQGNDGIARIFVDDKGVKLLQTIPPRLFNKAGFHTGIINDILWYKDAFYIATTSGLGRVNFDGNELIKIHAKNGSANNTEIHTLNIVNGKLLVSGRYWVFEVDATGRSMTEKLSLSNPGYIGAVFGHKDHWLICSDAKLFRFNAANPPGYEGLRIAFLKQCQSLQNILGKNRASVSDCVGDLILYFSFFKNADQKVPFEIQYRIDKDAEWQVLKGLELHLPEIKFGTTTLEYRLIQWGQSGKIFRLVLFKKPLWYSGTAGQIIMAILIVLLSGLLAGLIISRNKRRNAKNMQVLFNSIEEERQRLGREFHDAIGPNLSTIKLLSEYVISQENITDKRVMRLPEIANQTIAEIRNILNDISPETLKEHGLHDAVFQFIDQILQAKPHLRITFTSSLHKVRFNDQIEFHLYRIIQELIHNILKHSEATHCQIRMHLEENLLHISVIDNGKGLKDSDMNHGNGFRNIHSRTQLLRGKFESKHLEGRGTQFDFQLYLHE